MKPASSVTSLPVASDNFVRRAVGTNKPRRHFAAIGLAFLLAGCASGIADKPFYNPTKAHHAADGFKNPAGTPDRNFSFPRFARFVFGRLTDDFDPATLPDKHLMPKPEALASLQSAPADGRLTWIGHATLLIGLDGVNILTDPFFSERASPFSFAGPKRFVPPGLDIAELPRIDAIVISHNHYDSFDVDSLTALVRRNPETQIVVPLGLGEFVKEIGFKKVSEIDWFDRVRIGKVEIQSTPAVHRSNRGFFDINESLWTGFKFTGPSKRIWFSGDTGFGPAWTEWSKRIGPVDVALVPAGAFLPRDFMRPVHANPQEGVTMAGMMGARTAIGMHWGTLPLGTDLPKQDQKRFLAAKAPGVTPRMLRIGETVSLHGL